MLIFLAAGMQAGALRNFSSSFLFRDTEAAPRENPNFIFTSQMIYSYFRQLFLIYPEANFICAEL